MLTLWIDVEDLFEYATENPRPSGIQRLAFQIYKALRVHRGEGLTIHFVRHAPAQQSFRTIAWQEVAGLFDRLTDADSAKMAPTLARREDSPSFARKIVQRFPTQIRLGITETLIATRRAVRAWLQLAKLLSFAAVFSLRKAATRSPSRERASAEDQPDFATTVQRGDFLVVCGSPWSHPDYVGLVRRHRDKYGLQLALLIYDLIPLRRPEWCDRGLVKLFRNWLPPLLSHCSLIFTISCATARDIEAFAREKAITVHAPIVTLPVGTGLPAATAPDLLPPRSSTRLPPPGTYALVVSTIEARKNHLLLFRVWRRLLEDHLPHEIPALVFAGRVGWLVADLMQQIENTAHLDGKLMVVESPTDAELRTLYDGCLFTLFPSFYEGWGLPVSESLAAGKPCIISNRTSLPEAGGSLAKTFDPDNLHDAYDVIRNVIMDPEGLAHWTERVRKEFRSVGWKETAEAMVTALQGLSQAARLQG